MSPSQLELPGFSSPFREKLSKENPVYRFQINMNHNSIIIKHFGNFSDKTILQIQENMYMQYFLGYTSFTTEAPVYRFQINMNHNKRCLRMRRWKQ